VLGDIPSFVLVLAAALLLGLRHAVDPDHVAAVVTLSASDGPRGPRRAGRLGLAWGLGHALTLLACGIPLLLFETSLPALVERIAETGVALIVVLLALRLLHRWRSEGFHIQEHEHEGFRHRHLHSHVGSEEHAHSHGPRAPAGAFAVGLVHGLGGSAGVGLLLLATIHSRPVAAAALVIFTLGTAASMALLSTGFGLALSHGLLRRRLNTIAPALGAASLAFGTWYGLGALALVPYPHVPNPL
jgi:cytochrome c biogenesis protein CcdA